MQIITKSLRIIDHEGNMVITRNTPPTFDGYVRELISFIEGNISVRHFKTKSSDTQVISCVLQSFQNKDELDIVNEKSDVIAQRLLEKEIEAEQKISQMNIRIQRGSLIQALLYDENADDYTYLLAKVEHSDFVDDSDFTYKTGFSKDKKTIWKSCLIDLSHPDNNIYNAQIYSDTVAKFWSDDFLELIAMTDNESNTISAFKALDSSLNRSIKQSAPRDHTIIRNAIIHYFKSHEHFDFGEMLDSVLNQYQPVELSQEDVTSLRSKLSELPEKKHFDRQFETVAKAINARIKKVYDVNAGIQIKITDEIQDIENTISAFRDDDGTKYIKIKTNNENTFNRFFTP